MPWSALFGNKRDALAITRILKTDIAFLYVSLCNLGFSPQSFTIFATQFWVLHCQSNQLKETVR